MQRLLLLGFLLSAISAFAQTGLDENKYYAETRTEFIDSKVFNKQRELQIFLPDEYFKNPNKNFKVLYLFDAQNQRNFNFVSGNVQLLSMNHIEPLIIVGIGTEDRWYEFLPLNNHEETLQRYEPPMGAADSLIKHIEQEVEPYITKKFRTEDYRLAIGHSLGASFVTYASIKSKKLFDYNILISPNYFYDKEQFVDRFKNFSNSKLSKPKAFYFCIGYGDSYEEKFSPSLEKVIQILKENKNENINWRYDKLDIDGHGKTWLEGVYKGLLNWKY